MAANEQKSFVLPEKTDEDFESDHKRPKVIGRDFELEFINGDEWVLKLKAGEKQAYTSASQEEIALWKSREAMYRLFAEIYKAPSIEEVRNILERSKLDQSRIRT